MKLHSLIFLLILSVISLSCHKSNYAHFKAYNSSKWEKNNQELKNEFDNESRIKSNSETSYTNLKEADYLASVNNSISNSDLNTNQIQRAKSILNKIEKAQIKKFEKDSIPDANQSADASVEKEIEPYGKWSLIMGLNSIPLFASIFFGPSLLFLAAFLLALGAIGLGIAGISNFNSNKEKYKNKRNANAGLIIGLSLFGIPIIAFSIIILAFFLYGY